jgi:rhamnogalacturonyl hydrolase YesR
MFITKRFVLIVFTTLFLLQSGCMPMKGQSVRVDQSRASSQNSKAKRIKIDRKDLLARASRGCDWLTDVSQIMDKISPDYGAIRGEYDTKTRQWSFYGPFWHTGQAVRVLLLAYKMTGNEKYLKHAVLGGEYLIRRQVMDKNDKRLYGFIHGRTPEDASTASQLEGFMALHDLYKVTKDPKWLERFHLAVDWVAKNVYQKGQGLFYNTYSAAEDKLAPIEQSRPHTDDAVLWTAYQEFKDPLYLQIFREVSDRLLKDEDPPGNWIKYKPCNPGAFEGRGDIHPRHAWWWGYPMLDAFDAFGEKKYLDAAVRAAQWYIDNDNLDGGYYYHITKTGSKHLSFDFCTSAVGCAVIMWTDLWKRTGDEKYLRSIETSLGFLLRAQFNQDVEDQNIKGAFFEGYLPPDGTLCPGFYIRDIATIFAARSMFEVLKTFNGDIYYLQY